MQPCEIEILCRRHRALQSQVRSMKLLVTLSALIFGLAPFAIARKVVQDKPAQYVVARRGFAVVDGDGVQRALLSIEDDGAPSIQFFDRVNRKAQLGLVMTPGKPSGLVLRDREGSVRTFLGERTDGRFDLSFVDEHGINRVQSRLDGTGRSMLEFRDSHDRLRGEIGLDEHGRSLVGLSGPSDKSGKVVIGVDERNNAFDEVGR